MSSIDNLKDIEHSLVTYGLNFLSLLCKSKFWISHLLNDKGLHIIFHRKYLLAVEFNYYLETSRSWAKQSHCISFLQWLWLSLLSYCFQPDKSSVWIQLAAKFNCIERKKQSKKRMEMAQFKNKICIIF